MQGCKEGGIQHALNGRRTDGATAAAAAEVAETGDGGDDTDGIWVADGTPISCLLRGHSTA